MKLGAPPLRDRKIIIDSDSQLAMFKGVKEVYIFASLFSHAYYYGRVKNVKPVSLKITITGGHSSFYYVTAISFYRSRISQSFTNFTILQKIHVFCCISQAVDITSKLIWLYDLLSLYEHLKILKTVKNYLEVLTDDIN